MNNNPTVSVIIPIYNRAHMIGRAIQSVSKQSYQDFELIIVDDGSTDNTDEVVKEFQQKDKRITYIKHDKNKGGSAARNTGIKASKGKYIAFLDSDDEWLPEKLEKQVKLINRKNNCKIRIVGSGAIYILDREGKKECFYIKPTNNKNIFISFLKGEYVPLGGSMFLIDKYVFNECGLFDESLVLRHGGQQDYEMWLRIAKKYHYCQIEDYLVKYYLHSGKRITDSKIAKKVKSIEYIIEKYKDDYKKYPNIYSDRLRFLGSQFCRTESITLGRNYIKKAIQYNRFNCLAYFYYILSLLGPKLYNKVYKFVIHYKYLNENVVKKELKKV